MKARRAANIAVVLLVVLVVGVGASTILVTGDLPLQTNTGFTVTLDNAGTFPSQSTSTTPVSQSSVAMRSRSSSSMHLIAARSGRTR